MVSRSMYDDIKKAFPDKIIPQEQRFYNNVIIPCRDIYTNEPPWKQVKLSGLYGKGTRDMCMLNAAKSLCDEFSALSFSERLNITVSVDNNEGLTDKLQQYTDKVLEDNGFYFHMSEWLAYAYAMGGGLLKIYVKDGEPVINYLTADNFYPAEYTNRRITGGFFRSTHVKNGTYYTVIEYFGLKGNAYSEYKVFSSRSESELGTETSLEALYGDDAPGALHEYVGMNEPMFMYFKPSGANNLDINSCLGLSVFANCTATLKALDVAFDSFSREFVLGKKRIIVPSSCIRTVVDPETGNIQRYFDSDDEVYQALKCDEEKDLRITDNTTELRVEEHVAAINALLKVLCGQTGLSAGTLSFEGNSMKTAKEVVSENSKTYRTMAAHKNMLSEVLIQLVRCLIYLGQTEELGLLPQINDFNVTVAFNDDVIEDDETIIDRNIKLVEAGLKSRLSAVMEVLRCDEETAKLELERINAENAADVMNLAKDIVPDDA